MPHTRQQAIEKLIHAAQEDDRMAFVNHASKHCGDFTIRWMGKYGSCRCRGNWNKICTYKDCILIGTNNSQ